MSFEELSEIRMGSPSMTCGKVGLIGTNHRYTFERSSYQNKCLILHDKQIIVLVKWATFENEPGFEPIIVNDSLNLITKLDRIAGLCNDIVVSQSGFRIEYSFDLKIFYKNVAL
ncbi:hypothetical protein EHQ52_15560 [Leptospira koniambonensis]|uniref:Uncharacterized protein n=1 Tax=Leptospira koniambonensis TaxID=2484950 RepID=A0A4R9J2Y6_9LEPT|nr:hypothetical protein [Leptospira koniambonensis]TGL31353.1 hypothetical protein EHQ52_15560 [Leptospira koniambonensis]